LKIETIKIKANSFDMDWNRHVTSRAYERFASEARYEFLSKNGYTLKICMEGNYVLQPILTEVKFINQQFAGSTISVNTDVIQNHDGTILWNHNLKDEDDKDCCEIKIETQFVDDKKRIIHFDSIYNSHFVSIGRKILSFQGTNEQLRHTYKIQFSDMNFLMTYSTESIWKIFEEGRWMFYNELIDLETLKSTDTTSFFMGGQIQFYRMPEPGESMFLYTWIERIEKIRYYFRQDLKDANGNLISSMRDEQLFIKLSLSKPKRTPPEFIKRVSPYVEYPS
jgi:acyl-CoA thioesterase FadM